MIGEGRAQSWCRVGCGRGGGREWEWEGEGEGSIQPIVESCIAERKFKEATHAH
jgi:hypothetical protein